MGVVIMEEEPIEVDRAREEGRPSNRMRGVEPDGPVYPPLPSADHQDEEE